MSTANKCGNAANKCLQLSCYSEGIKNVFFLTFLQDLDAALPIIEKYKDHLVAIGEVIIQHL